MAGTNPNFPYDDIDGSQKNITPGDIVIETAGQVDNFCLHPSIPGMIKLTSAGENSTARWYNVDRILCIEDMSKSEYSGICKACVIYDTSNWCIYTVESVDEILNRINVARRV